MSKKSNFIVAAASLALGHLLIFLDFFLAAEHVIHQPTLWYFGQCCVLFGTVVGVIKYVDIKTSSNPFTPRQQK